MPNSTFSIFGDLAQSIYIDWGAFIMAIINLPVIVLLGKTALATLNDYIEQRKAGKDPVFKASSIGLNGTDFWN